MKNNLDNYSIGSEINFKEARDLADLFSIALDLKFTIDALLKLESIIGKDKLLMRVLWSSALISYRRCFNSGKRFGLSGKVFKNLKGEPIKAHKYYIAQANKHIAHSVNPFEQITIDLQLSNPKESKKIVGVSKLSAALICTSEEGIKVFKGLTIHAYKYTIKEAKKYEKKVLIIAAKLPIDNLYKKSRSRVIIPEPEEAGNARK